MTGSSSLRRRHTVASQTVERGRPLKRMASIRRYTYGRISTWSYLYGSVCVPFDPCPPRDHATAIAAPSTARNIAELQMRSLPAWSRKEEVATCVGTRWLTIRSRCAASAFLPQAEDWANKFYAAMEVGAVPPLLALDIEWCAPWFKDNYPGLHRDKVAVLQLASFGAGALVFQVHKLAELPPSLTRLLGDPGIALLGVNIKGDAVRVMQSFAVSGPAAKLSPIHPTIHSHHPFPSPYAPQDNARREEVAPRSRPSPATQQVYFCQLIGPHL